MVLPASIKKFLGTWRRDDQNVEYTIAVQDNRILITGIDTSDGEELRIQDVTFDGSELRFTTICISAVFSLRHIFRSVYGDEIEHQFTLTENWVPEERSRTMICPHLQSLEQAIAARGIRETYRGKPWSLNCHEWVYFDCYLDTTAIGKVFALPDCVHEHIHRGTHDGQERGFVCAECHDAIMGRYEPTSGVVNFEG